MKDRYLKFTRLLASLSRNIKRITHETIARYGIKRSYVPCIYFLYNGGPLSASKLSRLCSEDKANISRTIHALEEDGYAVKEERASARAHQRLMLTDEGAEIGKFLVERVAEVVEIAGEGIPPEEIAVMYSVLARIDANLSGMLDDID